VKVWFLFLVLSAGDNAIEQHLTIATPDKQTCHAMLKANDNIMYSKVYFTDEHTEVRKVLQKTCESGNL